MRQLRIVNNGYKLIELCKHLDMEIINGRFGNDQGVGLIHLPKCRL